ncbi:uncharacterized protein LOC113783871 [Coffea eugenioides]|uniref:uncharacterized protein LOC113783871 n=1 Tax=Coffea eugenioides TaxID=49369 RepID=UPI000F60DC6B|nr:uncharacterized protein LOC113783871 [Coffea eugenioides]
MQKHAASAKGQTRLQLQEEDARLQELQEASVEILPSCFKPSIQGSKTPTLHHSIHINLLEVGDLGSLAQQMVKTGKNTVFPLVYRLIQLALVLPVATASVERVFSAMNIVKTDLRNKMGDEWMNDCLVVYIEKDIFATIENEQILQRFQRMKTRRMQLPPLRYSSATTTNTSSVNQ